MPDQDKKGHDLGYFLAKFYDWCHYERDYEPKNYMRTEIWQNVSLLPKSMQKKFAKEKDVWRSMCYL